LLFYNKGNVYSSDGSLLATSIPNLDLMQSPKGEVFEDNVKCFPDSLATVLGSHRTGTLNELRKREQLLIDII
jgi:cell division protein FtsI (penicillin-binding protein 3)